MKIKFTSRLYKTVAWLMLLAVALIVPLFFGSRQYVLEVLLIMYIFIVYAAAWNLLATSGQGSLGHAAFLGLGGYFSVILGNMALPLIGMKVNPLVTILVGALLTAVIGVLIGLTCIRLKEWFLAMVTFGFAVIIHTVTPAFSSFTGGWDGLPAPKIFPASVQNYMLYDYYLMLGIAVITFIGLKYIMRTRAGLAFEAIRENEIEAKVMGVNVTKYKLYAFAVSAFLAGIAGALQIHYFGYITPDIYSADKSFLPIIYCITGGLFTIEGAFLGTMIITLLDEILKVLIPAAKDVIVQIAASFSQPFAAMLDSLAWDYLKFLVIGLTLIIIVIFLPKGFISLPGKIRSWLSKT
jgi:branched-chain amino acid transport system permease protein